MQCVVWTRMSGGLWKDQSQSLESGIVSTVGIGNHVKRWRTEGSIIYVMGVDFRVCPSKHRQMLTRNDGSFDLHLCTALTNYALGSTSTSVNAWTILSESFEIEWPAVVKGGSFPLTGMHQRSKSGWCQAPSTEELQHWQRFLLASLCHLMNL